MDIGIVRQYANEGFTRREIAKKTGYSYTRITTVIRENNIQINRAKTIQPKRGPTEQTKQILALREQGLLYREIAEMLGCCKGTVKDACVKYGLKKQEVLTEEKAAEIITQSGYEYVGGFSGGHKMVTVRCKQCGGTFERKYRAFSGTVSGTYGYKLTCPHCWRKEVDEYREKKNEPKKREAQLRKQRAAENKSRKINEQLARRLAIHVCKNCGQEFCMESSGYNSENYCSEKCQKRFYNRAKSEKRAAILKRRKHDTDITLEKLFKRDGGVCYICGKPCNWEDIAEADGTMIAGDNYPSIDHVVPVARGGTHTWDNIRLACRRCNTNKRDSEPPISKF